MDDDIHRKSNAATDRFNNAMGAMGSTAQPSELDKMKQDDLMASIMGTDAKKSAA